MSAPPSDAMKALTTSEGVKFESKPKSGPPMTNFPVPPELRDKIYSYLLGGREVEYTPTKFENPVALPMTGDGKPTSKYAFSLNILAVNKEIHKEAKEYFYGENAFTLVTYPGMSFGMSLYSFNVPCIEVSTPHQIKHASFTIKLDQPGVSNFIAQLTGKFSVVILGKDLASLFAHFRFFSYFNLLPIVCVIRNAEGKRVFRATKDSTLETPVGAITINANKILEMGSDECVARQEKFLSALAKSKACGYGITLRGFSDDAPGHSTLAALSPTPVWLSAYAWEFLDVVLRMKNDIDQSASVVETREQASQVVQRYEALFNHTIVLPTMIEALKKSTDNPEKAYTNAETRLLWFSYDLIFSAAWLCMRFGDGESTERCHGWAHRNARMMKGDPLSAEMQAALEHMGLLMAALQMNGTLLVGPQDPNHGTLLTLSAIAHRSSRPDAQQDGTVLTYATLRSLNNPVPFFVDPNKLSPAMGPVKSFNFAGEDSQTVGQRPERFQDWQDVEHLAKFPKEDKKKVQDFETRMGFAVTKFN